MTRRLEAGPLLVTLGGLLLLASLFLSWFTGDVSAWEAFEVWDLVLLVLSLVTIAAGVGLALRSEVVDRRVIPAAVAAIALIVASQIIDPPPAATGQDPDTGAWLALGAALLMCAGAVLTFGRVHVALTVEGRDPRQRLSAVDARDVHDPTTESHPAVRPAEGVGGGGRGGRLFGTDRGPAPGAEPGARAADGDATDALEPATEAGTEPRQPKQD